MATYLAQFKYSTASIKGMVDKPQNRREAAEKVFAAAGGKIEAMYFCFGQFDGVALIDFPSNVDAAAAVLAVTSSGAFSDSQTTVLISMEESVAAMKKAKKIAESFTPPAN
jgi:uncharacterized protein with GYD domain